MNSTTVVKQQARPLGRPTSRRPLIVALVVIAALGATLPLWTAEEPFLLMLASHAVIAAVVALSLDLLTGNTGLLSFGHAAWYGFGAYAAGLISKLLTPEMLIILPFVVLMATVIALSIGAILIRQIGKTFAILTLALSQIFYAMVFVFSSSTGGEDGLQGIPLVTLAGQQIVSSDAWFWLLYTVLVLSLAGVLYLRTTPLGRAWLAIRENTERARFIGIDTGLLKLIAYTVSAAIASLAGALFVLFNGAVSPDILHWFESGKILMYVVLGGMGTIIGPVFGAAIFTFAEHYISSFTDAWLIYFGGLFVIIVIVAPGGIFGIFGSLYRKVTGKTGDAA
ncbi:branched-chain amino acid ABC transporter permease [Hoeflea sp. G2-23]|uniref:Branched-chain amino acid ABC transporter permease n=1 Tax=Hoeflea algicola TaxID=2983763 RepID=A0ABT3ZD29_9HYPH|nr:branched-chain amino acid ABC transporter permease [Hoeflea algicola]MCY0149633.1 branched-chain amino acid ABC transporter permease [Hoeflea algicola]